MSAELTGLSFDVVIVGAGPAGCAAAIRAASHGLTVALLEKARFPRDVPGEALHPDVESVFDALGIGTAISNPRFIRYPGWILERSGERTFIPFSSKPGFRFGYQLWRAELDSMLLAEAQRAGVMVVQPAGRSDLILTDGRIVGVNVSGQRLASRHLIDASGTTRWVSRSLGLHINRLSPRLVAEYGYVRGDCEFGTIPEFHEHSSGWTWLARVQMDCCQCVRLALDPGVDLPPLPAPFDRLPRLRGADVTWRVVPECAGAGYFLCGDAAATLDPAAASGVARALAAGTKAADLIAHVNAGTVNEDDAAETYRHWLASEVATQALQLASRYADLESPPRWLNAMSERLKDLRAESVPAPSGRRNVATHLN